MSAKQYYYETYGPSYAYTTTNVPPSANTGPSFYYQVIMPDYIPTCSCSKPQGWVCPKCGRVWSPSVDQCWKCNDNLKEGLLN